MLADFLPEMRLDADRFCQANVHVNGFRTGVEISYLSDGLEIVGFHDQNPPYLRLIPTGVYVDPGLDQRVPNEDESDYLAYYMWDPRYLVKAIRSDEQDDLPQLWRAELDLEKLEPPLPADLMETLTWRSDLNEIEYVVAPLPGRDGSRLRQMGLWDFASDAVRVTLYFRYADQQ